MCIGVEKSHTKLEQPGSNQLNQALTNENSWYKLCAFVSYILIGSVLKNDDHFFKKLP